MPELPTWKLRRDRSSERCATSTACRCSATDRWSCRAPEAGRPPGRRRRAPSGDRWRRRRAPRRPRRAAAPSACRRGRSARSGRRRCRSRETRFEDAADARRPLRQRRAERDVGIEPRGRDADRGGRGVEVGFGLEDVGPLVNELRRQRHRDLGRQRAATPGRNRSRRDRPARRRPGSRADAAPRPAADRAAGGRRGRRRAGCARSAPAPACLRRRAGASR